MKYTKYTTFNCQGLNNDNKKSSLADDFLHHQITVMMLQEARITGQGVHKITSSNGTELLLYNSGHQSTSHGGAGSPVTSKTEITFKPISEGISILTTTMKKMKYCFISVYAPTSESTVKDSEKTRTFYEQLSDIISNINRNVLIIIGGHFNAKTKMRNRDPLLNKIIGKYAKSDINENGKKLIEPCNLHNLRITDTFFKHKPTHQTTWTSPAPNKNVNDSQTKSLQKNPYRNQIDYILVRNCETIKITDSKSTTNKITTSDHKPVIMKKNNYHIQKTLQET